MTIEADSETVEKKNLPLTRDRLLWILYNNCTDDMWHCMDKGTVNGKVTIQFNVVEDSP